MELFSFTFRRSATFASIVAVVVVVVVVVCVVVAVVVVVVLGAAVEIHIFLVICLFEKNLADVRTLQGMYMQRSLRNL